MIVTLYQRMRSCENEREYSNQKVWLETEVDAKHKKKKKFIYATLNIRIAIKSNAKLLTV